MTNLKIRTRIISWCLLPISIFLFSLAQLCYLSVNLDKTGVDWNEMRYELFQYTNGVLVLDKSIESMNPKDSVLIHLSSKNSDSTVFVCSTSDHDLWIYFTVKLNDSLVSLDTMLTVIKPGDIPTLDIIHGALFIFQYHAYEPMTYIVNKHQLIISKKLWTTEYYFLMSLAPLVTIGFFVLVPLFTIKDLRYLGHKKNMKMLKIYHYVFFFPSSEGLMRKHFNYESKRIQKELELSLIKQVFGNIILPFNDRKIGRLLYFKGESAAKIEVLKRLGFWNALRDVERNYLLKNFNDFIQLKAVLQNTVIKNMSALDSINDISLSTLTKERSAETEERIASASVEKSRREIFFDKLPIICQKKFFEFENLISEFNYSLDFIDALCRENGGAELAMIKLKAKLLISDLKLKIREEENLRSLIEYFEESDLAMTIGIVNAINLNKIPWKNRGIYSKIIAIKDWRNEEVKKLFSKESFVSTVSSWISPVEKSFEKNELRKLNSLTFLIVADFITQKKAQDIEEAFKKQGAEAFVLSGQTTKKIRNINYILLLTPAVSHSTGNFYRHYKNFRHVPFLNGDMIVDYVRNNFTI